MFGQGSPPASPPPRGRIAPRANLLLCAVLGLFSFSFSFGAVNATAQTADRSDTVRLRIAWGGGPAVQWQGTIELSDGSISEVRPLGVNPDETGSIRTEGGRLQIRQRHPRTYDGVDFLATATPEATMTIRLTPVVAKSPNAEDPATAEAPAGEFVETIPLSKLFADVVDLPIGEAGNRVLMMRSPGDALRVDFGAMRDSMVFSPGETLDLTLRPHRMAIQAGTRIRVRAQLSHARGGAEIWSSEEHREVAPGGSAEPWPLSIQVPEAAGVYDVQFSVYSWGLRERLDPAKRLLGTPLVTRTVQLVVYDGRPKERTAADPAAAPMEVVVELDPANPSWWARYIATPQLRKWSLLPKSSWDHGDVRRWEHPALRAAMRLAPESWEALPLPVEQLGIPHVVEIDYPSDMAQSLGVSILDPNAAGELVPVGLDSGVYVESPTTAAEPAKWLTHRLVFWPRTKTPLILFVNRDGTKAAVHGRIRVLAGPAQLPNARRPGELRPERLLAGYLERPLLAENFSASEVYDAFSRRSLDDWVTFYEASTRLAGYLDHVGYGGVMAAVLSEGSTIYPSRAVESTPRSDTGVFLSTGNDPFRKDALELLFRVFDERSLTLIPAVQFSTPLPALEALLDEPAGPAVGIVPIGPEGIPARTADAAANGGAPFYNVLDERVQQAMLDVIAELVERYGKHPSLGGVAIQLSGDGYGVLPGIEWSLDDVTWAAYEREAGQKLAATGRDRFARRAQAVTGAQRAAWLQWRAKRLSEFQRRAGAIVASAGQDLKLYVSAAGVWDSPYLREQLRPSLTRPTRVDEALLSVGIDVDSYRQAEMANVVLLRPNRFSPPASLDEHAADLALNQSLELDRAFAGTAASVFYHSPSRLRLPSFDEKSPVGPQKTYTWLAAQMSPSGVENRRRFVRALAVGDAPAMFDGGWMLPLGQEESLRDLIDVYRRLPAGRFETLENTPRPVTIRVRSESRRTLAYLTNDSPWPVMLDIDVAATARCRALSLSPTRSLPELATQGGRMSLRLSLKPYDVIGVVFTEPGVVLSNTTIEVDAAATASLRRRVAELGERQQRLSKSPRYEVLANANFEQAAANGTIPNWTISEQPGVAVTVGGAAAEGAQAATMTSSGRVAWLLTEWFEAPKSGRMAVLVSLRTADATRQPPLRVAMDTTSGRVRYHHIAVGAAPANVPLTAEWAEYLFPFEALPTTAGTKYRVRFDLMGAGEVRVDDVRLLNLSLSPEERTGFAKIVSLANIYVQGEQWADCADVLDGYWPRFVEENVPLGAVLEARRNERAIESGTRTPAAEGSDRVLDKIKRYTPFRN
jgi:hypothetical protein